MFVKKAFSITKIKFIIFFFVFKAIAITLSHFFNILFYIFNHVPKMYKFSQKILFSFFSFAFCYNKCYFFIIIDKLRQEGWRMGCENGCNIILFQSFSKI